MKRKADQEDETQSHKILKKEDDDCIRRIGYIDKRLTTFKSLIAHLNSDDESLIIRGLKAFKASVMARQGELSNKVQHFASSENRLSPSTFETYLKESPEFAELVRILETSTQVPETSSRLIELLAAIYELLEMSSNVFYSDVFTGRMIVRNLNSMLLSPSHLGILSGFLKSGDARLTIAMMTLLKFMVKSDIGTALKVVKSIPWKEKSISSIYFLQKSGDLNPRDTAIDFTLALVEWSNPWLLKEILSPSGTTKNSTNY
eukprot:TRINITY_DN11158_c0_g1_i3.p1 TRINITY_DN11158_c0_g1~~TRINITY_DN11158_c0_g1_i3.p1  ORF type:complete len:260 (+),score=36.39 TRINITY_DN11158_c0_g1_i3:97-876(+)